MKTIKALIFAAIISLMLSVTAFADAVAPGPDPGSFGTVRGVLILAGVAAAAVIITIAVTAKKRRAKGTCAKGENTPDERKQK